MKEAKIFLNVGTTFDLEQIKRLIEINDCNESDVKIKSVYGSLRLDQIPLLSARPDFRIAKTNIKTFEEAVKTVKDRGIETEYTVNALLTESVESFHEKEKNNIKILRYLQSVGVDRLIVSNPLWMELISQYTDMKIKISTILAVNNVLAIKHYANYRVDTICADIYANRNINLLREMQREGNRYGINIELLANEICMFGDVPCSSQLRTNCYLHSSFGGNQKSLYGGWPFERCQRARFQNPICWLKIPYILPQHLKNYRELTGITHYKISGRTNTSEYLIKTVQNYIRQNFDGNIQEFFMLPQNTQSESSKNFEVKELEKLGLFSKWLSWNGSCDYQCYKCGHCERIYEKIK